jgi:hypothetical protein
MGCGGGGSQLHSYLSEKERLPLPMLAVTETKTQPEQLGNCWLRDFPLLRLLS